MQRFIFKSKQICAGKKKILQKTFRYIFNTQIQFLHIRYRKCQKAEFFSAFPDLFFVYNLMDQFLKRCNINSTICKLLPETFQNLSYGCLSIKELFHQLIIHIHNTGKCHLFPDMSCFLQISHTNKGAIQGAHRCTRYCTDLHTSFRKSPPRTDLIRTSGSSSIEYQSIFFI